MRPLRHFQPTKRDTFPFITIPRHVLETRGVDGLSLGVLPAPHIQALPPTDNGNHQHGRDPTVSDDLGRFRDRLKVHAVNSTGRTSLLQGILRPLDLRITT